MVTIFFGLLPSPLVVSPTLLWLIAGLFLCFTEAALPTAFVAFLMGVSALLVAVVSLVVPQFSIQVILWLISSVLLIMASRRFVSKQPQSSLMKDAAEGETLTAISPGDAGRVLYEGNSWRCLCGDETLAIAPKQKVYIIGRKGNTLIIMPESVIKGDLPE